jgi:NAD-dependent deacetylase
MQFIFDFSESKEPVTKKSRLLNSICRKARRISALPQQTTAGLKSQEKTSTMENEITISARIGGICMTSIEQLQSMIDKSSRIVFFGGAGVSTESGIPDFRGVDGLYRQKYRYPPETILSHTFFMTHREEFFDFYRDKMLALDAQPNAAHKKLAELEAAGKLTAVVTQNIDGLHQKAGSKNVFELHGSVHRNYCMKCGKEYSAEFIRDSKGIPTCSCGGTVKPDVVLYEEGLDRKTLTGAVEAIANADMLIVGGTSLTVYPAAGLVDYYRGSRLVLINKTTTPLDSHADLVINGSIGETLAQIRVS